MTKVGKFNIELVPKASWGKSLAQLARAKVGFEDRWRRIRERELERAYYTCEICGISGVPLQCNERWEYDDTNLVQKLGGYEILCEKCHLVLHFGRTSEVGREEEAITHFVKITGLDEKILAGAVGKAWLDWEKRSTKYWKIDVSQEPLAKGFEEKVNSLLR